MCSTPDPWPRSPRDERDLPLACAGFVEKTTPREGLVEFRFFVSPEADAAVDASAPGWKPWHEITRDRERRTLEAFEGVRRRVRARGAPSSRDAGPDAARPAAARENAETGRVDDVVADRGRRTEAESGEVAPVAPQTAEGRVWFLAPAGKLSSASQSYAGAPPRASTSRADARRDASAD